MKDTRFNHTCPECKGYANNMGLHIRRHHPESPYAEKPRHVSERERYARRFAIAELEKLKESKTFASKYNGEYVLTKHINQAIAALRGEKEERHGQAE